MKLKSMKDFVLEQEESKHDSETSFWRCLKYANFLNQPLELGMFVPCDEDGNVITTTTSELVGMEWSKMIEKRTELEQAKERVLLDMKLDKGVTYFDVIEGYELIEGLTVENVTLTPSAQKQIL